MFRFDLKENKKEHIKERSKRIMERIKYIYFDLLQWNSSKKANNLMLIGLRSIINKSKGYKFDGELNSLVNKNTISEEESRGILRDIYNQMERGEFILSLPPRKKTESKKKHSRSKNRQMNTILEEQENEEDLEEVKENQKTEKSKQSIQKPTKPLTSMEEHVPQKQSEEKEQLISTPQESYCITLFKWIFCCSPCPNNSERDNTPSSK